MTPDDLLASLSAGQRDALAAIVKWTGDGGQDPLTLGGLAGTGKTTLAGLLPGVLPDLFIAYTAFTGKAVSVLRSRLPARVSDSRISTIHRLLYAPVVMKICTESEEGFPETARFCLKHLDGRREPCEARIQVSFTPKDEPLDGLDLVIVDEASMVPERLWQDLTGHGVPVLAIGDHGQLPPVQSAFSLMADPDLRLEEIHRQAAGSPVLAVARWAREQGHIPHGWYGPDVVKIQPAEIGYKGLHPAEADMIICATNRTRQYHNAACRAWHGRSGAPQPGDTVICLRNDYDAGLFNGLRGTVLASDGETTARGETAFRLTVQLETGGEPWTGTAAAAQFGAAETLKSLNRGLALFDWGYAITGHKSQGSSGAKVLVIEESWPAPGTELRGRWLYTVVTRSEGVLTVAGW